MSFFLLTRSQSRRRSVAGTLVAAVLVVLASVCGFASAPSIRADEPVSPPEAGPVTPTTDAVKPIRALLVTGGCCHDYERQKAILTKGISARANVVWTVAHQGGSTTDTKIPLYEDPHWADGYDVIVHNECFAGVTDREWQERILKPHRDGTPAVLIHCAMHCYRAGTDDWFEFCGFQSPGHGAHYAFNVQNRLPSRPHHEGLRTHLDLAQRRTLPLAPSWPTATVFGAAPREGDGGTANLRVEK